MADKQGALPQLKNSKQNLSHHPKEIPTNELADSNENLIWGLQKPASSPSALRQLSKTFIISLQRIIGNQAVQRLISREDIGPMGEEVPALTAKLVAQVKESIKSGRKQEAIDLIINEVGATQMPYLSKIKRSKKMKYEPLIPKPGVVHCKANKETMKCEEINVFLGDPAFAGGVPLYSTMLHEYEHVKVDVENPKAWIEALDRDGISPEELAVREFAGYAKEIMNLYQTGVIKDKKGVKHLGKMLKEKGWDDMSLMDKSFHKELYESCLYQVRCSFFGMLHPYRYIANNHHLNRAGRAAG